MNPDSQLVYSELNSGNIPAIVEGNPLEDRGSFSPSPTLKEGGARRDFNPAVKSMVLARMDEEYKNYRQAIEKTLDGVQLIIGETMQTVEQQLNYYHHRLSQLESRFGDNPQPPHPPWNTPKRIRWGTTEEEIRATVIQQAHRLEAMGKELKVDTIKTEVPGMLRWLYGERAVFEGIKGLSRALKSGEW